jgi:hypothetical protein
MAKGLSFKAWLELGATVRNRGQKWSAGSDTLERLVGERPKEELFEEIIGII